MRAQMQEYFDAGESYNVQVTGPPDIAFHIDGYAEMAGYSGWYFADELIGVEIRGPRRQRFLHWRVAGKEIPGATLKMPVNADLVIEPVFM
ncbi:MAG: hypothetical protein ACR2RB_06810 [Gammaproteobacteria bacterium]